MTADAALMPATQIARPSARLPWSQLVSISIYGLGVAAMWGGYELFGQARIQTLGPGELRGTLLAFIELTGAMVAIAVQPTIGTISDYTTSRWGRRKPFILVGACFDLVFILALVQAQSLLAFLAFLVLLQISSNLAQGPFQGYIPDLVPDRQVSIASGVLGLFRTSGVILGYFVVASGAVTEDWGTPLVAIGLFEVLMAVLTVILVREGPVGRPRQGRRWREIAREAWETDVLRERSFLFMSATRMLFMMGPAVFVNVSLFYVDDTLGLTGVEREFWLQAGLGTLIVGTVLGTLPGARLSMHYGRKRVIWGSAAVSSVGLAIVAGTTGPVMTAAGLLLVGIGYGAYAAVDWALMTSVIPRIASGRYMGLANIANSLSGPLSLVVGGIVMDIVGHIVGVPVGPRAAVICGIAFLAGASLMLRRVHPPDEVSPTPAAV